MQIKPLSAYPRPNVVIDGRRFGNTRQGMHGTANVYNPLGPNGLGTIKFLARHGFSWLKILSTEGGTTAQGYDVDTIIDTAFELGMGVIVRLYRGQPNPGTLTGQQLHTLDRWGFKYAGKPLYIEFNNEPDLNIEWSGTVPSNWLDVVASNAIKDCRSIQTRGLIPVLPAAATGSPRFYYYRLVPKMLTLGGHDVFNDKFITLGIHDYGINHPVGELLYESAPYPYDKVNQEGRPLSLGEWEQYAWVHPNPESLNNERAANKNPGQTVMDLGGASSVLSYRYQFNINVQDVLPAPIPVLATEGGVSVNVKDDGRYPVTTPDVRVARHKVLAQRLWHKAQTYNYEPWYFCSGLWLLDGDGSDWPFDGWFSGGVPKMPIYEDFFNWHRDNCRDMNHLYGDPVEEPEPQPDPEPEREREIVGELPTWDGFRIEDAQVDPGHDFWFLSKFEYLNEEASAGKHYIMIEQPHDPNVTVRVENTGNGEVYELPLEKPENEPAQIIIMWRHTDGNNYNVELNGLPSDKVYGLHLEGNRHISFRLWFEKRTKQEPQMSDYKDAVFVASPNFEDRPAGTVVDSLVIHATGGPLDPSIDWLRNPNSGVSAHYVIAKDGRVFQLVRESKRAWHAGTSEYMGRSDFNDFSIGIELENANDGQDPYPEAQVEALVALCRDIKTRHPIKRELVVSHAEIAMPRGRKTDPLGFDMEGLRERLFGLDKNLEQELVRLAQENQLIQFNPKAALQRAIFGDGYVPNSPEFYLTIGNTVWVAQRAEHLGTGDVRIYYVKQGDWEHVKRLAA